MISPMLKGAWRQYAVAMSLAIGVLSGGSALGEAIPWDWIDSGTAVASENNVFAGGNLSLPDGTVVYTANSGFQRNLFWDFENPHPEYPVFSGRYDPEFADYFVENVLHDGCDEYLLDDFEVLPVAQNGGNATQVMRINPDETEWWHLNNLDDFNPLKRVWFQFDYFCGFDVLPGVEIFDLDDLFPTGFDSEVLGWAHNPATKTQWGRFAMLWTVEPNPPWESIGIRNSTADPLWVDNFHVVTECVPEPSCTALLAGLCVGGGILMRRRRESGSSHATSVSMTSA